jgi:hypothetical protein
MTDESEVIDEPIDDQLRMLCLEEELAERGV